MRKVSLLFRNGSPFRIYSSAAKAQAALTEIVGPNYDYEMCISLNVGRPVYTLPNGDKWYYVTWEVE